MDAYTAMLLSVFVMGLLGGVHCAGMCGGVVAALGMSHSRMPTLNQAQPGPKYRLGRLLGYNSGRLFSYTALGAALGYAASLGGWVERVTMVQYIAYGLSQGVLLLMALYLLGWRTPGLWMERLGQWVWRPVQPLAQRALQQPGVHGAVAVGALWGLVPCGMVYGALSLAALSGSAAMGAALLLAFGLGTLPNLLLMGWSSIWLARVSRRPLIKRFAGLLIGAFSVMGLLHLAMAHGHT